jgi:uncharacterized protein YbaR (Trm112 family)
MGQAHNVKFSHVTDGWRCPACLASALAPKNEAQIVCANCAMDYPIINGIPILLDDRKSVFKKADFLSQQNLFFDLSAGGRRIAAISRFLPSLGNNFGGAKNYARWRGWLQQAGSRPRVLILGGSIAGEGMANFLADPQLQLVESDVSLGPRTQIILDAHNIPYQDASFDGVVAQAVLDPFQCLAEIFRVLRPQGLVYAETPFMQQTHGGAYDFHRFTHSGHRRLFRQFDEIASGVTAGPGTVMAWSYQFLLMTMFGFSRRIRLLIKGFARLTGFWLKYLDYLTAWNPHRIEAASGFYFMGKKSGRALSDEELIRYYKQAVGEMLSESQTT